MKLRLYSLISALILSTSLPLTGYANLQHPNPCDQLPGAWKGKFVDHTNEVDFTDGTLCTADVRLQVTPVGNNRFQSVVSMFNPKPKDCILFQAFKTTAFMVCNSINGHLSHPEQPDWNGQVNGSQLHLADSASKEGKEYLTTINLDKQS